jgi:hypothetical protein
MSANSPQDPSALGVGGLALLHAGAVVSGAQLPPAAGEFAGKGFALAVEAAAHGRTSSAAAFHAEVAEAAAYATGARCARARATSPCLTRHHPTRACGFPPSQPRARAHTDVCQHVCVGAPFGTPRRHRPDIAAKVAAHAVAAPDGSSLGIAIDKLVGLGTGWRQ